MNNKLKETQHQTRRDVANTRRDVATHRRKDVATHRRKDVALQRLYNGVLTILVLCTMAYTGLTAQTKEYRDLVILKDGSVINGVQTTVTKDSLVVTTSDGSETTYSKTEVSEVIRKAFDSKKGYKDLVILKDGTLWNGTQTLVTKDSLIVSWESGETMVYKKPEVSEVKKGVFDKAKGFRDTVTLKDGTVIEGAQTLVNRDSLIVTKEDGTATIYLKKEVSDVTKGKAEVAVKPSSGSGKFSAYQGEMNWNDAKAKCASLGMRLPTRDELVAAHKAGLWGKWEKEATHSHSVYWTSEEYSAESAYHVFMSDGNVTYYDKDGSHYNNVRCVR